MLSYLKIQFSLATKSTDHHISSQIKMNSETIEKLVFECGLQTPTVIFLSIALLLVCAWMLFRERHNLGNFWVATFWCLRAIAFSVLVWMFLQPARVTETKSTLPNSVAVVVDNSGSMQVVDPEREGQDVLWQLANLKSDDLTLRDAQVSLDSAIMALDVAQARWTLAQNQLQTGFDAAGLKERFEEIAFALDRASTQLDEQFCKQWKNPADQKQASEFASQCSDLSEFAADLNIDQADTNPANTIQRSQEYLKALVDLNRLAKTWSRSVSNAISQSLTQAAVPDNMADRQTQVMQLVKETDEQQLTNVLQKNLNLKRFTFDEQLTPVLATNGWPKPTTHSEPTEEEFSIDQPDETQPSSATNLSAAIEQITQLAHSQSIREALFVTDGAHNAAGGPSPAEIAAKRNGLAISFLPIGSLKQPRDIQLYHVEHPRSVIRGDKVLIDALVSSAGFEGETINLQLLADGELIDQKELLVDADQLDLRHSFTVPTKELMQESIEFELYIEPLEMEASKTNNRAIFQVALVRDKIRVMLADRKKRWENHYLEGLFYRDEHLEHEMILFAPRLRATGKLEVDAALPTTVEAWNQYDIAILGDLTPEEFPVQSQESLVEFVKEKGGVAILIAGRSGMPHAFEDQPLASILPVEKSDGSQPGFDANEYHVRVNPAAANVESIRLDNSLSNSSRLWQNIFEVQPITWLSEYSTPRPSARRLLDAVAVDAEQEEANANDLNQRPAWVCWQQLGSGRVVYLSAPDTYRMRYRRGDRLHHIFWAQLMRWILSSQPGSSSNGLVKLATDKVRYNQEEPVEVSALLSEALGEPLENAEVRATFKGGDDETREFVLLADETQPGRYSAKVEDLQAGAYRVALRGDVDDLMGEDETVETFVNVISSPNREDVNTTCNRPLMKQIAQASGGYVIPPTALAEWLTLQTGMPETISQIERVPLWNRWSCLWVAFGCLATEWFVRRLKGLT